MLEVSGLSKRFGGVRAVDGIDFAIRPGEVFGLIGPNGSGKSTTVNLVCGLFEPTAGRILFEGQDIARVPTHRRLSLGLARTFQNIRLFANLTVWENLWMAENAPSHRAEAGFLKRWIGGRSNARERIAQALEFSGLAHRADDLAGSLAFGEQRRLELARALAAKPKLLLLDEPAAGMNAEEIAQLDERIRALQQQGYTILLIEHHMELVMAVTDRVCVLNFGRKIAEGTPAEVQADPAVREAYLGTAQGHVTMLEVNDVVTAYGKIEALKGVSLSVDPGSITCLLGPNGAGKTTLMYTIAGILRPRRGSVRFNGDELIGETADRVVGRGIALVPENRLVFPQMSVAENLAAGAYLRGDHAAIARDIEELFARFPALKERRAQAAGTLSGGEQQMLAVARALMSRPKLLMMDEPSMGLAPLIVERIFEIVQELNRDGITIFMVEQNAHMALKVAHKFFLMEQGKVTFAGAPGQVAEDDVIRRAYLGSMKAS